MVNQMHGQHHQHLRKRIHIKHEEYPHPNMWKRRLDKLVLFGGVATPIFTIPQVYKIWIEQNAAGLSLISWIAYMMGGLFWLLYGFVHKEKPIIATYVAWTIFNVLIVAGIIMYG